MEAARKRIEFNAQQYGAYWPAVMMSERAESMGRDLAILYGAFPRALNRTLADVLEQNRLAPPKEQKIQVAEIVAVDDVPMGLKMSYTITPEGLLVCDLWTPVQPQLFGVQKTR